MDSRGFGHAFLSLSDVTGIAYKVTDEYSPAGERTILWNDPHLAIPWPIDPKLAILSDKDRKGLRCLMRRFLREQPAVHPHCRRRGQVGRELRRSLADAGEIIWP